MNGMQMNGTRKNDAKNMKRHRVSHLPHISQVCLVSFSFFFFSFFFFIRPRGETKSGKVIEGKEKEEEEE
jgi:hypothetical protein